MDDGVRKLSVRPLDVTNEKSSGAVCHVRVPLAKATLDLVLRQETLVSLCRRVKGIAYLYIVIHLEDRPVVDKDDSLHINYKR